MEDDHYKEYWRSLVEGFVHPMRSETLLGRFVSDSNLTGAYAEAWVRSLVRSMAKQYEVSTGAIIRSSDKIQKRKGHQCDIIIWDPSELPSPLAVGDFALVPSFSARALIEVKRTDTTAEKLLKQVEDRRKAMPKRYQPYALGVIVRNKTALFDGEVHPDWVAENKRGKPKLTRLLMENGEPDLDGIFVLVYMISHLCGHRGVMGSMG